MHGFLNHVTPKLSSKTVYLDFKYILTTMVAIKVVLVIFERFELHKTHTGIGPQKEDNITSPPVTIATAVAPWGATRPPMTEVAQVARCRPWLAPQEWGVSTWEEREIIWTMARGSTWTLRREKSNRSYFIPGSLILVAYRSYLLKYIFWVMRAVLNRTCSAPK